MQIITQLLDLCLLYRFGMPKETDTHEGKSTNRGYILSASTLKTLIVASLG
jgi:hypothetical protein